MSDATEKTAQQKTAQEKDDALLLDHDYDGIRELNYPLPSWWLASFYLTIVFAVGYYVVYQFGFAPSLKQELERDLAKIEALKAKQPVAAEDQAALAAVVADPSKRAAGKALFLDKCAVCHGTEAQGVVGPNLTDDYWLHGRGKPRDLIAIIRDGVGDKGMPPWGPVLSNEQILTLVSFVTSVRGSKPANAKPPQGELIKD